MKLALLSLLVVLAASASAAFDYETGGCATAGCADGEQWLFSNANELDAALDAIESNITTLQGRDTIAEHESVEGINVILSTEIDTAAELNDLTTDTDMVLDTDIGVTVQAFDADLSDLADGSLSGSKIGSGLDAAVITTGVIPSSARLPSDVILSSEIDTTAELNAILLDDDFLTANGSYSIATTGSGAFSGTLTGLARVNVQSASSITLSSSFMAQDIHYCTNAAGCDVTLPGAAPGLNACFYDGNGGGTVILDAAAGDAINLDGISVGTADAIDSAGNVGDFICLLAIDASTWVTLGRSGTWVDGGAD